MSKYVSIIPKMTSNSANGFTVSADVSDAYLGVDGSTKTCYRSSIQPSLPGYFTVTFPKTYKISKYSLSLGFTYVLYANMATWDLEGLVNGKWAVLHSGSHSQVAETLEFYIEPVEVSRVRVKCKTRSGGNSWGFDELSVYELVYDNQFLIQTPTSINSLKENTLLFFENTNEDTFINYGIPNNNEVNLQEQLNNKKYFIKTSTPLDTGKVFKQKIDSSKTPIKSVSIT